ncbi:VOC family protein [Loktanella sp. S4079]|uniref:VOC family protein n=1 Tax=Loktanella sp. S4079 TaxID=579483 RepID=UPI0005F9FC1A|nr:VOC family protein [Loktanella sp. S4079]KJZ20927.1 hypothetical protein TW80_02230 [Loktanella sp. S4079]
MFILDHLAVGAESLDAGVAWVEDRLGVALQPGGHHEKYGTHNKLLGLADGLYLEVIAKDPHVNPLAGHSWFDLDRFSGPPRVANWICRADVPSAYANHAGPVQQLSRGDLRWSITVPGDGRLPFGGGFPTLLKWADGITPPSQSLPPSGLRLIEFVVIHPEAAMLQGLIPINDPRIRFEQGESSFVARFEGPDGVKELS